MFGYNLLLDDDTDSESDDTISAVKTNDKSSTEIKEYTAPYRQIQENVYIMNGKEAIQMNSEKIIIYNKTKVSLFWGKCFLCGCIGHSQRYCPLKYCSKCQSYGHSLITCVNDSNLKINQVKSSIHPSMTSKNWRKKQSKHLKKDQINEHKKQVKKKNVTNHRTESSNDDNGGKTSSENS